MESETTWSYSRLSCYVNQCSLQYFFRYCTDIEPVMVSSNLILGSGVHTGHEMIYSGMMHGQIPTLKEVKEGVEEDIRIREHIAPEVKYNNGGDLDQMVAEALKLTKVLYASVKPEPVVAVNLEEVVDLVDHRGQHIGKLRVIYDLITGNGEAETIVDLKSAKQKIPESRLLWDLQPTCYQVARQASTGKTPGFRYDVLYKKKSPEFESIPVIRDPQKDAERLIAVIRGVARGVSKGVFLPNRGSMNCASCGWEKYCSSWPD